MIAAHVRKRSIAFSVWIALAFLAPMFFALLSDRVAAPSGDMPRFIGYSWIVCILLAGIFWIKAHYHWSRAKGYSGWLTLLALLGFPIAPIVLACLNDQRVSPPSLDDPIRHCPHCNAVYRLGDYNPDAERILCATCKGELPRSRIEIEHPPAT